VLAGVEFPRIPVPSIISGEGSNAEYSDRRDRFAFESFELSALSSEKLGKHSVESDNHEHFPISWLLASGDTDGISRTEKWQDVSVFVSKSGIRYS
jgi:hypothetical protein